MHATLMILLVQFSDKDSDLVIELVNKLYAELDKAKMLGKHNKRRSTIMKTIFRFLDFNQSPVLLLTLSKLSLALKVTSNNLTNVCKMIYKVAKEDKHDDLYMKGNILGEWKETMTAYL